MLLGRMSNVNPKKRKIQKNGKCSLNRALALLSSEIHWNHPVDGLYEYDYEY